MSELRLKSTGTIKLFENDNTSSVTIASPASLGADRTITLPDGDVTLVADTTLANTPSFYAYQSSAQTIANNTTTVVILETESFDTNTAYNTTDGKFTIPSGMAGKYYFGARVYFTVADASRVSAELYKNTTAIALNRIHGSYANTVCVGVDTIVDCSVSDYVLFKVDQSSGSSQDTGTGISLTSFFGFKLI
jgi:hypothetical protein